MARFMLRSLHPGCSFGTPDPYNAGADPTNPQSWNMYSYVINNPLDLTDPTGMDYWVCIGGEYGSPYTQPQCQDYGGETISDLNQALPTDLWAEGDNQSGAIYSTGDDYGSGFVGTYYYFGGGGDGGGGGDTGGDSGGGGGGGAFQTVNFRSNDPCAAILGTGGVLPFSSVHGQGRYQFNASGFLVGIALPLTGNAAMTVGGYSFSPNTSVAFLLNSPGSLTVGFSNPIDTPGFLSAEISSVTYSNGVFTQVNGAAEVGKIPFGRATTPSGYLLRQFNRNLSALSMAATLLKALDWASKNLDCETLLGGQS
jgi:hypothetical protein